MQVVLREWAPCFGVCGQERCSGSQIFDYRYWIWNFSTMTIPFKRTCGATLLPILVLHWDVLHVLCSLCLLWRYGHGIGNQKSIWIFDYVVKGSSAFVSKLLIFSLLPFSLGHHDGLILFVGVWMCRPHGDSSRVVVLDSCALWDGYCQATIKMGVVNLVSCIPCDLLGDMGFVSFTLDGWIILFMEGLCLAICVEVL